MWQQLLLRMRTPCEAFMIQVSFIIPVRDDERRLETCLDSIARLHADGVSKEVIVVDNGSKDGSATVAARMGAHVVCLPGLSVAQLRNHGATCGRGEILAFVDADHVLDDNWLTAGVKTIMQPRVGIAGAPYDIPEVATWVQRAYNRFRKHPLTTVEVEWLGSGNIMVRRDLFTELAGFDENLETCEDVDLCNRARAKGWRIIAEPGMRSIHLGDPSTLRKLFLSEIWRGRNNWRVTFRGPVSLATYASLLIPVLNLLCLAMIAIGIVLFPVSSFWRVPVGIGLFVFACLTALQSARLSMHDLRLHSIAENVAVAAVYNLGRAFALIARASHKTRHCTV